jgi:hypothetical protein
MATGVPISPAELRLTGVHVTASLRRSRKHTAIACAVVAAVAGGLLPVAGAPTAEAADAAEGFTAQLAVVDTPTRAARNRLAASGWT